MSANSPETTPTAATPGTGHWKVDRSRYGARAWLVQPSYWTVAVYRFGRWTLRRKGLIGILTHGLYFIAYSFVRLATGIDVPRSVEIGPGLLIHHFGGIIIHPQAKIGANVTMRHGVTIGARDASGPPTIGDNVVIGAYAQVLGSISVGDNSTIGALSLVIHNVTAGSVVVGIPAKTINRSGNGIH